MKCAHNGRAALDPGSRAQAQAWIVKAYPDAGDKVRSKADEPGIGVVVGRAGLARCLRPEADAAHLSSVPSSMTDRIISVIRMATEGRSTSRRLSVDSYIVLSEASTMLVTALGSTRIP